MSIFADTLQFFHYVMMLDIFVGLDAGFITDLIVTLGGAW
jgi:hypothetical protein